MFLKALTNKRKQWRSDGPVARVQQLPSGKREESPSDEVRREMKTQIPHSLFLSPYVKHHPLVEFAADVPHRCLSSRPFDIAWCHGIRLETVLV